MTLIIFTLLFLIIDYYVFLAVVTVSKNWAIFGKTFRDTDFGCRRTERNSVMWWTFGDPYKVSAGFRNWVLTGLVAVYFSKFLQQFYLSKI
jgi:hypothetical protein